MQHRHFGPGAPAPASYSHPHRFAHMTAAVVPGWPATEASPFHPGEQAIQLRLGVREKVEGQGRKAIRAFLPDQHREFYTLLPFAVLGTVDQDGQPHCSVVFGAPGFMTSPDEHTLRFNATIPAGDPLAANLRVGADVGLLGIQLSTRRRNRANGTITAIDSTGFTMRVKQTYGNCPQYIQIRNFDPATSWVKSPAAVSAAPATVSATLTARAREIISAADTFFLATSHFISGDPLRSGCDASHRGGKPGFVQVTDDSTLTAPDFVGNFMFNTLGNLSLHPRTSVLFVDFTSRDVLYLTCDAEIIWDGDLVKAFAGAERLLRFKIRSVRLVPQMLPIAFSGPEFSPILDRTGSWPAAEAALEAARTKNVYRPFKITQIIAETDFVRSIYLEPADGKGIVPYVAGQFLPIRVTLSGTGVPVTRTYTISDAPNGRSYRLSVKREGVVSAFLHSLKAGDAIEAVAPRGDFVFDFSARRPVVMIGAGIGVTPLLAMLNDVLVNEGRTRHHNRLVFIYIAKNGSSQPFRDHLRTKAGKHSNLTLHVRFTQPEKDKGDAIGRTHDGEGRLDKATLQQLLPLDDYDFYLCGPSAFMQSTYDVIRSLGVPDARVRFEAFGPASVKRARDATVAAAAKPRVGGVPDIEEAVEVCFAKSNRRARWTPKDGSLLELAEAQGLTPPYSCRNGACGTCAAPLLKGEVIYTEEPIATIPSGNALICCSVPRPGAHMDNTQDREGVTLDL